jgi:hypothetical protein
MGEHGIQVLIYIILQAGPVAGRLHSRLSKRCRQQSTKKRHNKKSNPHCISSCIDGKITDTKQIRDFCGTIILRAGGPINRLRQYAIKTRTPTDSRGIKLGNKENGDAHNKQATLTKSHENQRVAVYSYGLGFTSDT